MIPSDVNSTQPREALKIPKTLATEQTDNKTTYMLNKASQLFWTKFQARYFPTGLEATYLITLTASWERIFDESREYSRYLVKIIPPLTLFHIPSN